MNCIFFFRKSARKGRFFFFARDKILCCVPVKVRGQNFLRLEGIPGATPQNDTSLACVYIIRPSAEQPPRITNGVERTNTTIHLENLRAVLYFKAYVNMSCTRLTQIFWSWRTPYLLPMGAAHCMTSGQSGKKNVPQVYKQESQLRVPFHCIKFVPISVNSPSILTLWSRLSGLCIGRDARDAGSEHVICLTTKLFIGFFFVCLIIANVFHNCL